ncbi:MAG: hypothetical protein KBG15_12595 [Kofleriaceae bacterium]|nr:hypothetical protein [Kofleriaceae bacterium]
MYRPALRWLVVVVASSMVGPGRAAAEPDYRPSDRFFFGLAGGAGRVADGDSVAGIPMASTSVPAAAYETSFWPSDYLGLSTLVAMVGTDVYDVGGQVVVAVPLRWVQPYAGAMAGWRTTASAVASRVHLVVGMNGYVNRNVRVYVELRDPEVTLIGATHRPHVIAGVRWSPDWFHSARRITKFDTVWWSTLLAVGLWTGATLAR